MRHTTGTILLCCREAINTEFPADQYPPFTRTGAAIKFLHGAAEALFTYDRKNESGIINDVIAGIKRDGLQHLELRIREAENLRNQVTGTVVHD